jgi:hypothetical protein
MKSYSKIQLAAALCFLLSVGPAGAASEPPAVGGNCLRLRLPHLKTLNCSCI